jgi:hypothetical protein
VNYAPEDLVDPFVFIALPEHLRIETLLIEIFLGSSVQQGAIKIHTLMFDTIFHF